MCPRLRHNWWNKKKCFPNIRFFRGFLSKRVQIPRWRSSLWNIICFLNSLYTLRLIIIAYAMIAYLWIQETWVFPKLTNNDYFFICSTFVGCLAAISATRCFFQTCFLNRFISFCKWSWSSLIGCATIISQSSFSVGSIVLWHGTNTMDGPSRGTLPWRRFSCKLIRWFTLKHKKY